MAIASQSEALQPLPLDRGHGRLFPPCRLRPQFRAPARRAFCERLHISRRLLDGVERSKQAERSRRIQAGYLGVLNSQRRAIRWSIVPRTGRKASTVL